MPHILAAPCFVLLLAASGMAIDSNRSLLSTRDVENIRAAKAYHKGCKLKHGTHNLHVYQIYAGGSWSLAERNAGDTLGEQNNIFPLRGAGCSGCIKADYEKGYIAMVHASYNHWHTYPYYNQMECDPHSAGSHHYKCQGGSNPEPGRHWEGAKYGYRYSFPRIGKDKHWWESSSSSGQCGYIQIKAKCLINLMAKAGGKCPHDGCDSLSFDKCSNCIFASRLSSSQYEQVWDNAIWNKKCHRYKTEVDDELNDDLDPDGAFRNTSRSEAPRAAPQPPADSSTGTTSASTDKGVVVV